MKECFRNVPYDIRFRKLCQDCDVLVDSDCWRYDIYSKFQSLCRLLSVISDFSYFHCIAFLPLWWINDVLDCTTKVYNNRLNDIYLCTGLRPILPNNNSLLASLSIQTTLSVIPAQAGDADEYDEKTECHANESNGDDYQNWHTHV